MVQRKRSQKSERAKRAVRKLAVLGASQLKRDAFYALENPTHASLAGKVVGAALFVLILLNAVLVFVSAQPGLDPIAATTVRVFYAFSTLCFAIEYAARVWIADLAYGFESPHRARLHYMLSPLGIIDFLSFGPNMIAWFVPMTPVLMNVINVVRLVRLVKISRYMRGLRTIGRVITKHYHEIVAAFLVIGLLIIVSSVVMYEIEHPAQPNKFNSLLSGVYWAVTTVTGTGYGDLVPITPAGRVVGSIIMLLSVALVAIPGGIFSAGFVAEFQNANLRKIERDVRRHERDADTTNEEVEEDDTTAEEDDDTAERDDEEAERDDATAERAVSAAGRTMKVKRYPGKTTTRITARKSDAKPAAEDKSAADAASAAKSTPGSASDGDDAGTVR